MENLKRNMCDLDPLLVNSEVRDLGGQICERMAPTLRYACVHIAAHVSQMAADGKDIRSLVTKFARERLMYWLEGLSLMGRTHEGITMVTSIEKWLKSPSIAELALSTLNPPPPQSITVEPLKSDDVTSALLFELQRFIMDFIEPIVASTPHIYSSALLLMPSETELSRQYVYLVDSRPKIVRGCAKRWSRALWTAKQHDRPVSFVAISPDSSTIVSGSYDRTPQLLDARTGLAIGEAMEGHTKWVKCVAISPDGTTIVPGSCDHTLRLWNANTGATIGEAMEGHTDYVQCIVISPDGTPIISGSDDYTLQMWDVRTGVAIGEALEGHTDSVNCIALSPDDTKIISGSSDCTLQLWDVRRGVAIKEATEGYTDGVKCVADGTTIVSGSDDYTLRLWDPEQRAIGQAMQSHTHSPTHVAFLNNGKHMISIAGNAQETLMWDHTSQTLLPNVELEEASSSMADCIFRLDGDGWLWHSGGQQIIWVPVDLRGALVLRHNILTVVAQKVPVLDVSGYVV
ncbi:hypothetical protein FRB95_008009 [Tulasnella sp. JGI-2019a]|nr:hypothetical protein FRB95_008009 [Tulasnella sp. JGI-2019a]